MKRIYVLRAALLASCFFGGVALHAQEDISPKADKSGLGVAGNEAVRAHIREFAGRGAVGDQSQLALSPNKALAALKVADPDLTLDLVLHEPAVRQPLFLSFDARGRMWVVQYLQYPFPAGLKIVKYDQHLRAVFDKVPVAPPNHVRGADKITIHEDTNGDGQFDTQKTFVEGLNITTSVAFGRGGVWVLTPPYLLFYPDRDGDDVPDGDPEVHLSGFGLEDTHAVANNLHWGPDGWLYGAQGSTCWATVDSAVSKDVHFKGQAIWRYHPQSREFEVFGEGGGNTFHVEFDSKGRVYSGTNWGALRGVHYVQGGRYVKNWGKHGELMNPHSYGFFDHMPHTGYQARFSHSFILYEGGQLPDRYQGKLLSIIPLHNRVQESRLVKWGSTFATEDTKPLVTTDDRWFRPVFMQSGPDGSVYVADWHDTRLTHVDPRDTWDRTGGRIYRLRAKTAQPIAAFDLAKLTTDQLIDTLSHSNEWFRQTAQRLLADRRDRSANERLAKMLGKNDGQIALESLWALHASGGFDADASRVSLEHKDPFVRMWGVRLLGDRREVSADQANQMAALAGTESHAEVRSQLASTALRIPADAALPILWNLASRDADMSDPHIPLLVWWAIESKAVSDTAAVLDLFAIEAAWDVPMIRQTIMPRLSRRYAAEPTDSNQLALVRLLASAPGEAERNTLLDGIAAAFEGRRIAKLRSELSQALKETDFDPSNAAPSRIAIAARAGDDQAYKFVLDFITGDDPANKQQRIAYIGLIGQVGEADAVPVLLEVVRSSQGHSVRRAALSALQRFDRQGLGAQIVKLYGQLPSDQNVRETAIDVLSSRQPWALDLLKAVENKQINRSTVDPDIVQRLKLHGDTQIDQAIAELWGQTRATSGQRQARIAEVRQILGGSASGDLARGKALFTESCAKCHRLHGNGETVGPELTGYERDNLDFMLLAIIDPSAAIREEFTNFRVLTVDGLVLTGYIKNRGIDTVTIQNGAKGPVVVPLSDIEEGPIALSESIMPDRLLAEMTAEQVRDLFAYLRSSSKQ